MNPLDFLIPVAHAQAAGAAPAAPSMMSTLLFPIILIAIMYFLMIRPQMKRTKEHRAMLDKLSVGDEVITNGGIAGNAAKRTAQLVYDSYHSLGGNGHGTQVNQDIQDAPIAPKKV